MKNINNNQFREDEIAIMTHWDKKNDRWVKSVYPKVGGRLRLAHEENEKLSITTEIIRYDENIAVVSAVSKTKKGSFKGIGMASVERDMKIAPAILELAETRAIARSLRFAGFGVEYCSAEEISHLNNVHDKGTSVSAGNEPSNKGKMNSHPKAEGGQSNNSGKPHQGNGNSRITQRQYGLILKLIQKKGISERDLNKLCVETYGTVSDCLSRPDASSLIQNLMTRKREDNNEEKDNYGRRIEEVA